MSIGEIQRSIFTFCTPECTKEIDSYLDYRKRRGENITQESCLLVTKFSQVTQIKDRPFKNRALRTMLQCNLDNSGLKGNRSQTSTQINDEQLLKDIANGAQVISYNEQKSGKECHVVRKLVETRD